MDVAINAAVHAALVASSDDNTPFSQADMDAAFAAGAASVDITIDNASVAAVATAAAEATAAEAAAAAAAAAEANLAALQAAYDVLVATVDLA